MTKKDLIFLFIAIIISILIISGFTIFKLVKSNRQLRDASPVLMQGEKLKSTFIIDKDGNRIDLSTPGDFRYRLIYSFSTPCYKCNKNLNVIKRMYAVIGDKIEIIGLIPAGHQDAFEFEEDARLKFKIYIPEELKDFKEKMKIKMNLPYTMLIDGNHVAFIRVGDIEAEDLTTIVRLIKKDKQ